MVSPAKRLSPPPTFLQPVCTRQKLPPNRFSNREAISHHRISINCPPFMCSQNAHHFMGDSNMPTPPLDPPPPAPPPMTPLGPHPLLMPRVLGSRAKLKWTLKLWAVLKGVAAPHCFVHIPNSTNSNGRFHRLRQSHDQCGSQGGLAAGEVRHAARASGSPTLPWPRLRTGTHRRQ